MPILTTSPSIRVTFSRMQSPIISSSLTLRDKINILLFFSGLKEGLQQRAWTLRSVSGVIGIGGPYLRARRVFSQEMFLELLILPESLNQTSVQTLHLSIKRLQQRLYVPGKVSQNRFRGCFLT